LGQPVYGSKLAVGSCRRKQDSRRATKLLVALCTAWKRTQNSAGRICRRHISDCHLPQRRTLVSSYFSDNVFYCVGIFVSPSFRRLLVRRFSISCFLCQWLQGLAPISVHQPACIE